MTAVSYLLPQKWQMANLRQYESALLLNWAWLGICAMFKYQFTWLEAMS